MLLDEVANYLQAQGIGTVGTDLFKDFMPDSPNTCVSLFCYQGLPSVKAFGQGPDESLGEQPRLQVVCRGEPQDGQNPAIKADAIRKQLDGLFEAVMGGVRYQAIQALSAPFLMGRDENLRVKYVCNYQVMKELS